MKNVFKKIAAAFAVVAFVGGALFMSNTNDANALGLAGDEVVGCAGAGACVIGGQTKDFAISHIKTTR